MTPTTLSAGMIANPMVEMKPTSDGEPLHINQREHVPMSADPSVKGHISPISSGYIIGEGAAIFMDMTETMLTTLD